MADSFFTGNRFSGSIKTNLLLGAALLAVIIGAQVLVMARPDYSQARDMGAQMVQAVRQQGLESYFGQEPVDRFYLIQEKGEPVGYGRFLQKAVPGNGALVYQGREIIVDHQKNARLESTYFIDNHLSYFRQIETDQSGIILSYEYNDGQFKIEIIQNHRRQPLLNQRMTHSQFIPKTLLDFFSSLATEPGTQATVLLAIADLGRRQGFISECLVQPGGEVPEVIRQIAPNGHAAQVRWLAGDRRQTIYYDQDHQLIWQKEESDPEETTFQLSDPQQLESIFGDLQTDVPEEDQKNQNPISKQGIEI